MHSLAVNVQILSDGFSVAGLLFLLFAGMLYISGEGGLIGIGYVMQCVFQAFVPMGRRHHESYAQYRERKIGQVKSAGDNCVFVTGLVFFSIGVILTVIWYTKFYNVA